VYVVDENSHEYTHPVISVLYSIKSGPYDKAYKQYHCNQNKNEPDDVCA
jgi:hypothetical protein